MKLTTIGFLCWIVAVKSALAEPSAVETKSADSSYSAHAVDREDIRFGLWYSPKVDDAAVVFLWSPDTSKGVMLTFDHRSSWRQVDPSTFLVIDKTSRRDQQLLRVRVFSTKVIVENIASASRLTTPNDASSYELSFAVDLPGKIDVKSTVKGKAQITRRDLKQDVLPKSESRTTCEVALNDMVNLAYVFDKTVDK
jgi:hypothetical protein